MKLFLLSFVLVSLSQVYGWKPISHPAAFSVFQTFHDTEGNAVSRSSSNTIVHGDSVDTLLNSFNKNEYSDVSGFCGSFCCKSFKFTRSPDLQTKRCLQIKLIEVVLTRKMQTDQVCSLFVWIMQSEMRGKILNHSHFPGIMCSRQVRHWSWSCCEIQHWFR